MTEPSHRRRTMWDTTGGGGGEGNDGMPGETHHAVPETMAEALRLLREPDAVALAGGTAVVAQVGRRPRRLVDLRKLGLDQLTVSATTVEVGAMVTVTDLLAVDAGACPGLMVLQQAGCRMASTFIRNAATVGGSTVACYRWSDLPAALLAADAVMVLRTADGAAAEVSAVDFFDKHPVRLFRDGAVLERLRFHRGVRARTAFTKLSALTYGYAVWDVAVLVPTEHGARVAVSAGCSLPRRLRRVEAALDRGPCDRAVIEAAAAEDLDDRGVVGNRTVSAEYRRTVGPVIVADTVERARSERGCCSCR